MIKFIDLFAGIGGIRLAFEQAGGVCVFSSEWDKFAQKTYTANFGEIPAGDITKIDAKSIPHHDLLLAGFPCQPFSISGVSKKNSLGKEHGFTDETQGTLFFDIARILEEKSPEAFMLENVKNLISHDKKRTFKVIERTLKELGYKLFYKILDARYYVPQHRERIFIVGFREDLYADVKFQFPTPPDSIPAIGSILEPQVDPKYTITDKLWVYLQDYAEKHRKKGNGFGYGLVDPLVHTTTRTLSARYYKDGSEILIKQEGKNPRRLTPRECARLMGFPDSFNIPVSDTQAYKQFGNSVAVPLVQAVATCVMHVWNSHQETVNFEVFKPRSPFPIFADLITASD
ncbi:MAG: DNA (cytosine-5-)-methyltransferase [Taibaiella sp.]|nr:DNA (cytosine-5-)-methyltransferase [Taibaiella sp.]